MSDVNRVTIPYGSQPVSNKSKNVTKRTIRLVVKLPQSNEDTCPEYNYKDELDAAKKRGSSKNIENGGTADLFDDDDGDVRRIAMQMEEKYGKGVAVSKKRRRGRKDDYADIGMGYDESDSFIDNTDGYDEIIPQNVTTLHGGFYINCGALEFKTDDEESMDSSSSSSGSQSGSPRNGKRALDTDGSDQETDQTNVNKKTKLDHGANGMQKALKKKLFSPNKILKKKRSSNVHKRTVKDLLKEKRKVLNLSGLQSEAEIEKSVLEEGEENVENGKNLSSSINDAIESVVKASDEPMLGGDRLSSQVTDDGKPIQLPENLPNNISEVISKIKQTTVNSPLGNKFTDEINSLLLSLERKCKCLGKPSKTKVYEHLSYFIKVEKQVLIQHCSQLALKDEEKKIKSLLQKLQLEIDKLMPSIVSNYKKECDLVLEKRTLLQLQNQDGGEEKRKSIGRPKRKFQWNDQTKKYLKDTATIKKRSYLQQGNSKESWEEELTTFLKNNVLHLWPEGWMTMTTLTKVCNKLFNDPKTANHPSNVKKENKNTAVNTPVLPYPNISITPVTSSIQNKPISKTNSNEKCLEVGKVEKSVSPVKEHIQKESFQKEHLKEKDKIEPAELSSDRKNNGNMFFKVDYDKPPLIASSSKPQPPPTALKQQPTSITKPQPVSSVSRPQPPTTIPKPQSAPSIPKSQPAPSIPKPQPALSTLKPQPAPVMPKPQPAPSIQKPQPAAPIMKPQPAPPIMKPQLAPPIMKPQPAPPIIKPQPAPSIMKPQPTPTIQKFQSAPPSQKPQPTQPISKPQSAPAIPQSQPAPSIPRPQAVPSITKPQSVLPNPKPMDLMHEIKEPVKFPNVNIIDLDAPHSFSNLLPKSKSRNEFEFQKCSNSSFKNTPSESNSSGKEKNLINEFAISSTVSKFPEENHRNVSDGDDIQKVMEHLKNLQKMSSPVKTFEGSSSSNPGFSQKSSSVLKNNIDLVTSSFQDEFQKQLLSALGSIAPNTSKSNYKCS